MATKIDFKIEKKERIRGLFVFCNNCKRRIDLSVSSQWKSKICDHPAESLVYRFRFLEPVTKKSRVTVLAAKNKKAAITEALTYRQQLDSPFGIEVQKSLKFDDLIPLYLNRLSATNIVDENERKSEARSKGHIEQVGKAFEYLNKSLKKNYNKSLFDYKVDEIKDEHVVAFQSFLKGFLPKISSVYRYTSLISTFYNFFIDRKKYKIDNYFKFYIKKSVHTPKPIVSIYEIEKLILHLNSGNANKREVFKDETSKLHDHCWLSDYILLSLLSGGRREEVCNIKFSDIIEKEGKPHHIKSLDLKVSRSKRLNELQYLPKKIYVTDEIERFLIKLGYYQHKGSDRYLICPERTYRLNIFTEASHDFSFFCKQIFPNTEYTLKMLRKIYCTKAREKYGEAACILTGHKTSDVIVNHYLNHDELFKNIYNEMNFGINVN
jgi:hypothetical protein